MRSRKEDKRGKGEKGEKEEEIKESDAALPPHLSRSLSPPLSLSFHLSKNNTKKPLQQPKYIIYATYLSEKIGYWRYISIYRHLQRNPSLVTYPLFEYFENWCQDENRHGDFFAAVIKAKPGLIEGTQGRLWSRFFCLSVRVDFFFEVLSRSADFSRSDGKIKKLTFFSRY